MLGILDTLADELRGRLRETLFRVFDPDVVQGAHLQFDNYWYVSFWRNHSWQGACLEGPWNELGLSTLAIKFFTMNWHAYRPPDWEEHCRALNLTTTEPGGLPSPVIVRVTLHNQEGLAKVNALVTHADRSPVRVVDQREWPRSVGEYAIVYEVRSPAIATSGRSQWSRVFHRAESNSTGISLGRSRPNSSGTTGLTLVASSTGQQFAVTCAHVVGPVGTRVCSPGPFEDLNHSDIGVVRFSTIPALSGVNNCSFDVDPTAGRLDVALVELEKRIPVVVQAQHVRQISDMAQEQEVEHYGKESGFTRLRIAALTIWQSIYTEDFGQGPPGFRCLGGLFQLMGADGDRNGIARPGDSGAPITDSHMGLTNWSGILVARQDTRAFGCFAAVALREFHRQPLPTADVALATSIAFKE